MDWIVEWDNTRIKLRDKIKEKDWIYRLVKSPLCEICGRSLIKGTKDNVCWDSYRHKRLSLANKTFQLGEYFARTKLDIQEYEDILSQHILGLKDNEKYAEPIGVAMGMGMVKRYPQMLDADYFVPIPSYNSDRNHSTAICETISRYLHETIGKEITTHNCLMKVKDTQLHNLSSLSKREEAVQDMYVNTNGISILGKDIILIDDILTSADTKGECLKILKNHGAKKIWVYVAAGNV